MTSYWQLGVHSVKSDQFGALGDNVADDTAAIQAAIDYVDALSTGNTAGGVLFFPPGKYLISDELTVGGNVSFLGSSRGSIIAATAGFPATVGARASSMLWSHSGTNHARTMIQDMHFDGAGNAPIGVLVSSGASWEMKSLRVDDVTLDGLVISGVQNSAVYGARIANTGRHNIRLINGARYIGLIHCFARFPGAGAANLVIDGDDADYPSGGSAVTSDNTIIGGLYEGTNTSPAKAQCVLITNSAGLQHKFYGVAFHSNPTPTDAYVRIGNGAHRTTLDRCGWAAGGNGCVPLVITDAEAVEVINPRGNNLNCDGTGNSTGNCFESSIAGGLKLTNPYFQDVTASAKILAATGGVDYRKCSYEHKFRACTTAQRPSFSQYDAMVEMFDTTLGRPIWWHPGVAGWRDADGNVV